MAFKSPGALARRCEFVAAATLLATIAIAAIRLFHEGRLPAPFYDWPDASLMDLHSTAWWAHHHGAYEGWRAVYPPFAFALLKLSTLGRCYVASPEAGRSCDWLGQAALFGAFALNFWLLWLSYRRVEPATAAARAFIIGAGLPMLYALERGNLLVACFTAFVLGAGPLLARPVTRWAALAVAVNLKPYLLAVMAPAAARRDGRWLLGFGAAGLILYLATWLLFGEGSPAQLIFDLINYAPVNPALSRVIFTTLLRSGRWRAPFGLAPCPGWRAPRRQPRLWRGAASSSCVWRRSAWRSASSPPPRSRRGLMTHGCWPSAAR